MRPGRGEPPALAAAVAPSFDTWSLIHSFFLLFFCSFPLLCCIVLLYCGCYTLMSTGIGVSTLFFPTLFFGSGVGVPRAWDGWVIHILYTYTYFIHTVGRQDKTRHIILYTETETETDIHIHTVRQTRQDKTRHIIETETETETLHTSHHCSWRVWLELETSGVCVVYSVYSSPSVRTRKLVRARI